MDIPIRPLPPQPPFVSPPIHERRGLMTVLIVVVLIAMAIMAYAYLKPHHTPPASTLVPVNPQAAYDKNDLLGALAQLDQLLKTNPQQSKWLILKSLTLSQKGIESLSEATYGPQAEATAQQAILIAATSSEAYRALGFAQEIQGKYAEAEISYKKVLELDPRNTGGSVGQAHIAEMQGSYAKAQSLYQAALTGPSSFAAVLGLARVLTASGHPDQAQPYFISVYKADKNPYEKAEAEYALAMSNISKGGTLLPVAETQLQEAARLVPFYLSPQIGLAIALYAQGKTASSSAMLSSVMGALRGVPQGELGAHVQIKQDLEVIGDTTLPIKALQAAGFDALIAVLKKSSITTKP